MALSSRMQNLDKMSLRRNPAISRGTFHETAAQMMRKDGRVTKSVEKALKQAGLYYGKKSLSKSEFEKGIRKFSAHLGQGEVRETRFAKDIRKSLRTNIGIREGSIAEKIFQEDIKKQLSSQDTQTMDPKIRNRLRIKLMEGQKLTKKDLEGVPEEELDKLKSLTDALKSIHQRERAEEIEREKKEQTDEGQIHEKTKVSAAAREDQEEKTDQSKQGAAKSETTGPVPIQGGFNTRNSPENQENFEHLSNNQDQILPPKEESNKKEISDSSTEKEESIEEKSTEPPDMEIG